MTWQIRINYGIEVWSMREIYWSGMIQWGGHHVWQNFMKLRKWEVFGSLWWVDAVRHAAVDFEGYQGAELPPASYRRIRLFFLWAQSFDNFKNLSAATAFYCAIGTFGTAIFVYCIYCFVWCYIVSYPCILTHPAFASFRWFLRLIIFHPA